MKYAIEILETKLDEINKSIPEDSEFEEEDLIDAVLHNRQKQDLKFALKILNQFAENYRTYRVM